MSAAPPSRWANGWIFGPRTDLAVFLGPLVVSGAIVALAARAGRLHEPVPPMAFVLLVVGCDVAHVYATLYRTYLDAGERRRRSGLLTAVPLACLAVGATLYALGALVFWRVLAYLATFHFVRQTWGWMSYAARRAGETSRLDRRLDQAAVYAATVFPLLWWHAHLPREFTWLVDGDYVSGLSEAVARVASGLHFGVLGAWVLRQAWKLATGRPVNGAKALVLSTTWAAWYGGIVWLDSDLAFTASNVLAHGVPYFVLVHRWGSAQPRERGEGMARLLTLRAVPAWLGLLVLLAYLEESAWDAWVWHQYAGLFGWLPSLSLPDAALALVVPLLAVPQATHYVLDAFLWRTGRANPELAGRLHLRPTSASTAA